MNALKQYNISLPRKLADVIDQLPNGEKGKFIATAVKEKIEKAEKELARQKVKSLLANIKPVKVKNYKGSVDEVEAARNGRSEDILNN